MSDKPTKPTKGDGQDLLGLGLLRAMLGDANPTEGLIEQSEARGQQELVSSNSIPSEWVGYNQNAEESDTMLRQMGFEIGKPFEDDPLFRPAMLPEGWKKVATNHAMHSDILDENGFARVGIFYKAAFYDRKAHISLKHRLRVTYDPRREFNINDPVESRIVRASLPGGDTNILIIKTFEARAEENEKSWHVGERLGREARAWLQENYPDHDSPLVYWDTDFEGETYTYT